MELLQVFVYGTLKPGEANFQPYCQSKGCEAIPAMVWGQLYSLPFGYPALTAGDRPVFGYLLRFPDATALMELDQLEDYEPDRPIAQNEYTREQIEVFQLDRTLIGKAWVYRMQYTQVEQYGGIRLPHGQWTGSLQAQYWQNACLSSQETDAHSGYRISDSEL